MVLRQQGRAMFDIFGPAHLGALAATVLVAALVVRIGKRPGMIVRTRSLSAFIAFVLLANEVIWHIYQINTGTWELTESLPLHLCDAAIFVSLVALLTRKQVAYELAYFWGLGGSVQALLTPALTEACVPYEFCRFFISHGGILVAVAYLTFVRGMRPGRRSIRRTIGISLVYAAAVAGVNQLLSANYMYLSEKPATASILDKLGPWPWYLIPMFGIGMLMIVALYLPLYIIHRRAKESGRAPTGGAAEVDNNGTG